MADNHTGIGGRTDHSHGAHGHVPGTMDITQQQRTFAGFLRLVGRAVAVILAVLIFLALANA
ncbi:aa3 type cytochrome c oxidase subunit IV [Cereibacter ovatus]|uniref:Aa3 type cytochrome c oxidase subunit IV n=1 Tax=Cereibacter ovatus TaxID=439529 RepID=A0A285CM30_9RHOB|nr:aa3-type cytochrome c oxidase subunit IV [Cereibacter ovatus]SNX68600.1 aa3 type cytochrome c oxidase subunit IV [Cereibacter ovatus]